MYRRSQTMANSLPNPVDSSQFLQRLVKLPIVNSAIGIAGDYYGKVKNSGGIVGRTVGVAERAAIGVAGKAVPYVQIFSPLAAQPLGKVDGIANYGLEKIEYFVPVITKEPSVIYNDTKDYVTAKVTPVVQTADSITKVIVGTRLAQFGLDIVEGGLDITANVINRILPAGNSEKNGQSNGFLPEAPEDKTARLGFVARKAIYLVNSVYRRVFGIAQSRVESISAVTDNVMNSARKTLNDVLDKAENQQNGDAKPAKNKPKKSQ